jgi:cytochrome P450
LLGNLHQLDLERLHLQLERWAEEHGQVYVFSIGPRRVVVLSDPDTVLDLLRGRPAKVERYGAMREVVEELGICGVVNAEGAEWKKHRRLVAPALAGDRLRNAFPEMLEITDRLYRRWGGMADREEPIEVVEELMRYVVDITCVTTLGRDLNTLESGPDLLREHLSVVFPAVHRRSNAPFPYWRYLRLPSDRKLERSLTAIRVILQEIIDETRTQLALPEARGRPPRTLVESLLLAAEAELEEERLSDEEVMSDLVALLLTGEDTTAYTIAWMLELSATEPRVARRLAEEADRVLGEERLLARYEDAKALPYTGAVMKETLRLKSPAPLVVLEACEELTLGGAHIPTGTSIFALTRSPAMREESFGQPNDFLPERWLDEERPEALAHRPEVELSFGAGPRVCPGRPLAMLEAALVSSMVARSFTIEKADGAPPVREQMRFAMGPDQVRLQLRRR